MNTMFDTRPGPPAISLRAKDWAPASTCPKISAADKFRVNPACPVAQNGQFMPQPAWDEIQIVTRDG
jgi:hypothetical protein